MIKSGVVSIVGRPNSGKSTLLNRLVGEKVSIVTDKPQTTRHIVRGIVTHPEGQITFLDTPGIHKPMHRMNERMMKSVREALADVDLILLMADCSSAFGRGDAFTLDLLRPVAAKKILLLNKIDRIDKKMLLPMIDQYSRLQNFEEMIPISALTSENLDGLVHLIFRQLPEGPMYYPPDQISDQQERGIAAEMIREKLIF